MKHVRWWIVPLTWEHLEGTILNGHIYFGNLNLPFWTAGKNAWTMPKRCTVENVRYFWYHDSVARFLFLHMYRHTLPPLQGLASYCKAETTFTFYFSISTLSNAFLGIDNREMKSESGFSFAIASQPFRFSVWVARNWKLQDWKTLVGAFRQCCLGAFQTWRRCGLWGGWGVWVGSSHSAIEATSLL